MLFGNDTRVEKVGLDAAHAFLDSCLDQKLSRFATNSERTKSTLISAVSSFSHAIEQFQELDAKPDKEYMRPISDDALSSQKISYSKVVLHSLSGFSHEFDLGNSYNNTKELVKNVDELIYNVLKANNTFKVVIKGYANNLQEVKRLFLIIERSSGELKEGLNGSAAQFNEYSHILDKIKELSAHISEIAAIKRGDSEVHHESIQEDEINDVESSIAAKATELDTEHKKLLHIESLIKNYLLPMERAARKYDHISMGKRKLVDFILEPAATIRTDEDYNDFKTKLTRLRTELGANKIDVKNRDELVKLLDSFDSWNIYDLIKSLREPSEQISTIRTELGSLNNKLDHIKTRRSMESKRIYDMEELKKRAANLSSTIATQKSDIEQLFLKYYKKKIELILPPH